MTVGLRQSYLSYHPIRSFPRHDDIVDDSDDNYNKDNNCIDDLDDDNNA